MKSTLPTISIITPSFNQGVFIKQTLDSIHSQAYPQLEHFVMDGGSTDHTVDILKAYGSKITWQSQKDKGQTDALNQGFAKSSGDILCWLNSDDLFPPGVLLRVGTYFRDHPDCDWLAGDFRIIDGEGKFFRSWAVTYKRLWRSLPNRPLVLKLVNILPQPSVFWRRTIYDTLGGVNPHYQYAMDYDYWLRIMDHGFRLHIIPDVLSHFRIHRQSKTGINFTKQFDQDYEVLTRYTHDPLIRFFHKFHNQAIIWANKITL